MRNLFDDLFENSLKYLDDIEDKMWVDKRPEIPDGYVHGEDLTDEMIDAILDDMYGDDMGAEKARYTL